MTAMISVRGEATQAVPPDAANLAVLLSREPAGGVRFAASAAAGISDGGDAPALVGPLG